MALQSRVSRSAVPLSTPPPTPLATFKSRILRGPGSPYRVFISYVEGPELFFVHLAADAREFEEMMNKINRRPHSSLAEPPMIGTICLGRMSADRPISRAVIIDLSESHCKLFFVDFGNTAMVSYYDIFDIPEDYKKPYAFAIRFCLSGVKKLEKGPQLNKAFKQLVTGDVLSLRVVTPEGPPLIQYSELYLQGQNVLDLLLANMNNKLQFTWIDMLPVGSRKSVAVCYVESCLKFYIQISDKIGELNAVMDAVKLHCESSSPPGDLPVGSACCARYPGDDNWYRARIRSQNGSKVTVAYVDYGNEQEVHLSDLRTITPELMTLPAQAVKCALQGFENKPVDSNSSILLEMLALEKTFTAAVVGVISDDTMLVSLVDDTQTPPLDIARHIMQVPSPRCANQAKVTTPVRRVRFSLPEGSEKRAFTREKSFKDNKFNKQQNNDWEDNKRDNRGVRRVHWADQKEGSQAQVQHKELPDPVPLETPFLEPNLGDGKHKVSITWIISAVNYYVQYLAYKPKFIEMMHKIPELYKGVKPYTGMIPVGASVLARYSVDGVLYRATVLAIKPCSKFLVQYVDYGNQEVVDAKDIWQLDRQLMELPIIATHICVAPQHLK